MNWKLIICMIVFIVILIYTSYPKDIEHIIETPTPTTNVSSSTTSFETKFTNVRLNVDNIMQNPELPTGCEITSATILLNYYGYSIDKEQMCAYLPQSYEFYTDKDGLLIGPDTTEYFVGDPHIISGRALQCFAPVIEKSINSFLSESNSIYVAKSIVGKNIEYFYSYLNNSHPICIWTTIGMSEATKKQDWYNTSMELVVSYRNIHCLVMTGYDDNYIYVADPLGYADKIEKNLFADRYESVGSQAVVLEKRIN